MAEPLGRRAGQQEFLPLRFFPQSSVTYACSSYDEQWSLWCLRICPLFNPDYDVCQDEEWAGKRCSCQMTFEVRKIKAKVTSSQQWKEADNTQTHGEITHIGRSQTQKLKQYILCSYGLHIWEIWVLKVRRYLLYCDRDGVILSCSQGSEAAGKTSLFCFKSDLTTSVSSPPL